MKPPSLTTEIQARVCKYIEKGYTLRSCVKPLRHKVSARTLYNWYNRGKDNPDDPLYGDFYDAVESAYAVREKNWLKKLQAKQKEIRIKELPDGTEETTTITRKMDRGTLKWLLSRTNPDQFGDKQEVTGQIETNSNVNVVVSDAHTQAVDNLRQIIGTKDNVEAES